MKAKSSSEIRQMFLDFFAEMHHTVVASAPLPVPDNPTLFFNNAGMNQFVDCFLGREERAYKRAATSQKCMRIQGKHNDLENVGPSPRHHTFFEMLGNFSFGDYFKEDAIKFAYSFITVACAVPAEKLIFTVHTTDDEAYSIWSDKVGLPAAQILRMGDKTNFWMMGDTGPCGPTSEIHYDWGIDACTCQKPNCSVLLDNDCDRWLEVWNLVFMQYNQQDDGSRIPLPQTGVDTGMGLERITSVVQQTPVNYDNDLFRPAMDKIQELLGHSAEQRVEHQTGYRVIADHCRAATFLIGDGMLPGNLGGNYVLRMVIRRAARFGRNIGFTTPFLADIADAFIATMGTAYPELNIRKDHIRHTLTQEEERFARTLDSGLRQLDELIGQLTAAEKSIIPGETAFQLYATHGLPLEITRDVVQEHQLSVDEAGFLKARAAHALASGSGAFGKYNTDDNNVYTKLLQRLIASGSLPQPGVSYNPYAGPMRESIIVGIIENNQSVSEASAGAEVGIITQATPFYVESGGELSDTGFIYLTDADIQINDVTRPTPGLIVHHGQISKGTIAVNQPAVLLVDEARQKDIRRNHTATHVLHRELQAHLGAHVTQAGSLVAPNRLRFDFTHNEAVPTEKLEEIELAINHAILHNYPVSIQHMEQQEAINAGAMALFGEKYGDIVRTVQIGFADDPLYSFELCGGLHVAETAEIGAFHFVKEEAVSSGVRRVEAVTGFGAHQLLSEQLQILHSISKKLSIPTTELADKVDLLLQEQKRMQKELLDLHRKLARNQFDQLLGQLKSVAGVPLLTAQLDLNEVEILREMADWFRDHIDSGIAVLATVTNENKPLLIATVTEDLIKKGIKAGDLIKEIAPIIGGGGGGRPNLAQAGGKNSEKLPEALAQVTKWLQNHPALQP